MTDIVKLQEEFRETLASLRLEISELRTSIDQKINNKTEHVQNYISRIRTLLENDLPRINPFLPLPPLLLGLYPKLDQIELEAYDKELRQKISLFLSQTQQVRNKFNEIQRAVAQIISEEEVFYKNIEDFKNNVLPEILTFIEKWKHFCYVYGVVKLADPERLFLACTATGNVLSIFIKERLEHIYLIGTTGSGKSKLLESLIIQDLINGIGGCLIDPFGGLFQDLCAFIFYYEDLRKQLIDVQKNVEIFFEGMESWQTYQDQIQEDLGTDQSVFNTLMNIKDANLETLFPELNYKIIDLSKQANKDTPQPWRINPFELESNEDIHDLVDVLIRSVERFMGQSSTETPQLGTVLEGLFSYMITEKKSLKDILDVLDMLIGSAGRHRDGSLRVSAETFKKMESSTNPTVKQAAWSLKFLLQYPHGEFIRNIQSTVNRLRLFNNPIVHNFLNTPKSTLHLEKEINGVDQHDRRSFLLFHIPSNDSKSGMVATYLLSRIDTIVRNRSWLHKKLPFFVYADEFPEYVDLELAKNFAKTRQYGLGFIVAHQNLTQLREKDERDVIRDTAIGNCTTRLIMRVQGMDSQYIVDQCFEVMGNMERVSYSDSEGTTTLTGYNVGETTSESKNSSKTQSRSQAKNWSDTFSSSSGYTVSKAIGKSSSTNSSQNSSFGDGNSSSSGVSHNTVEKSRENGVVTDFQAGYTSGSSSTSSVISSNSTYGSSNGYSSGTSETNTNSENKGESKGNSKGGSETEGNSDTEGISNGFAETKTHIDTTSRSESSTVSRTFLSYEEEQQFLAQELKKLDSRELFVCGKKLITQKAVTLDSITAKLEHEMQYLFGDMFYPRLLQSQMKERLEMKMLLERKKDELSGQKISQSKGFTDDKINNPLETPNTSKMF